MEGWNRVILEDLGFVGRGKSRHRPRNAPFLYGNKYPFVQTADVKSANNKISKYSQMYSEDGLKQSKLWPKNTLCITIAANIADAAILDLEACFPDSVIGFIPDKEISDVQFVKYLFDILQVSIKQISQGAAQDNLSLEKLRSIKFLIPPLPTQRKIAKILSAYDDLIENNLKRIKLLEEMAQKTYEEWFVRFKFPGYETAKFDKETGLPEGWEKGKLKKLMNFVSGYAFKSKDFQDKGTSIIKIKNIGNKTVDIFNTDFVNSSIEVDKKFHLVEGDLIIAMTGATIGKVGFIPANSKKIFLNQRVGKLIPKGKINNTVFTYTLFNSEIGILQILNFASGAAQPNISGQEILSVRTVIPTEHILTLFNQKTTPMIKTTLKLYYQNQRLKEARDILLPRLMTGMISV